MSVPSGGFSGSMPGAGAPSQPAAPQSPQQVPSHLRVIQPTQHQQDQADDYRSLFEKSQQDLADLGRRHGETSRTLDVLRKKSEGTEQTLNKLRHVFVPESDPSFQAPDPVADEVAKLEQSLDWYIQKGFEAEKNGNPIPLTIDNAIRTITGQIKSIKEGAELKATVAKLTKRLEDQANPSRQLDGQAYQTIDGLLVRGLDTLYGPGDENLPAKNAQWTAAIQRLQGEVQNLQKNHADVWDKARRNPQALQRLVNHVLTQNMPPKARQIIETERLRAEPMTMGELQKAYREAMQLQDPRQRERYMTDVRREILAFQFNRKTAGRRGA